MKDSRGTVACDEVDFAIVVDGEAGTARGEGAFVGEGWGHRVTREFFPVLAIGRADEDEFSVDGIAEREAFLFGDADERVEEELRARARKLELPGVATVVGLVDARHFSRAAGHDVGELLIEGLDSAEIERLTAINEAARIVFAAVI